jgi:uncharacterized protein
MSNLKPLPIVLALMLGAPALAQDRAITIGTGGQTGVYHVLGQSICRLVNRETGTTGLTCDAIPTGGSIDNINAVRSGDMDMGVAQSDWQYHAFNGSAAFAGDAFTKERAVFSVHSEPFTVIARKDAGIASFDDLRGKRVNVGNLGSGQLATMEVVLAAKGWSMGDFANASHLEPTEQAAALGDNAVDAIIYTIGHPNGPIQEAVSAVAANLVPVEGEAIDKLVADNPFYAYTTIPGGMYAGTDTDTRTFGVRATFVTSADTPDHMVYAVVKAVFDDFDRFKKLHPVFEPLKEKEMIKIGLSAPLHAGAIKYYTERGWM